MVLPSAPCALSPDFDDGLTAHNNLQSDRQSRFLCKAVLAPPDSKHESGPACLRYSSELQWRSNT